MRDTKRWMVAVMERCQRKGHRLTSPMARRNLLEGYQRHVGLIAASREVFNALAEPTFEFAPSAPTAPDAPTEGHVEVAEEVTSQVTSQSDDLDTELARRTGRFPQLVGPCGGLM
jgi:hypothetical protein